MKKNSYWAVLAALLLLGLGGLGVPARGCAALPSSDQAQSDSTTSSKTKKKPVTESTDSTAAPQAASGATSTTSKKTKSKTKAEPTESSATDPPAAPPTTANSGNTTSARTPPSSTAQAAPPANSNGRVWVNTDSGIYHKAGTRWYGKTKQGKYMTEADAQKAGYRASKRN